MGLDTNEKLLADYNDVFADIINVLVYDGKRVVKEDDLENSKDKSQYKAEGKLHEQERDVSKYYKGKQMRIAFLGIEHQNYDEPFMPLRIISYDGSAYRAQILDKRKHTYPVITLVLYFGTKRWPHGKSLYDVLDIPKELEPYVSDYKINVVDVAYLTPEQIEKFQSDFRLVADFFVKKRLTGIYNPPNLPIKHVDAFLKLLSVMVGDKRYQEIIDEMNNANEKEEQTTMCEIYDQIMQKGIEQERVHTEEQRRRAEAAEARVNLAEARAKAAEEELARLRKSLS